MQTTNHFPLEHFVSACGNHYSKIKMEAAQWDWFRVWRITYKLISFWQVTLLLQQPVFSKRWSFLFATDCSQWKCIWHEKYFLLIWKAFHMQKNGVFRFQISFFCFRDIDDFLLRKLDQWWRHTICNWKVVKQPCSQGLSSLPPLVVGRNSSNDQGRQRRETLGTRLVVKYWINDISGNIKAMFLKLGTTDVHHKRNKMTPLMLLPWQLFGHWCCLNKNLNSQFLS